MRRLTAVICLIVVILTGCGGYSDASVDVPSTWAQYTIDDLQFRFKAGWKSGNWDPVQTEMDTQTNALGTGNQLAIFGRLVSPSADKGTVDYIDFGYWDTGREYDAMEMEELMEDLNNLIIPFKRMGITSQDGQSSRIRIYGEEITALTLSYKLNKDYVNCVVQIALVPHGTRIYMIAYSDFSTGTDDDTLEQLLTSLHFLN